tara:strand:+ start:323 stop:514 length:192 start_codon:yes stop_codon:yes gene_type:complete
MYVLVLIMSIAPGYVQVKAVDYIYPTMDACKQGAEYIRSELMSAKPTPKSTVSAYCTEIPKEV